MSVYLLCEQPISGLDRLDFPFTPQIDYSQDVKHDVYGLTHTNYQPYAFSRSENPNISLTCKFAAHSIDHFKHSERAIRFLRTYTKMNYGRQDNERGIPPRILRFNALGNQIFNNVPVYISKFSILFPEDIDYVGGEFDFTTNEMSEGARLKTLPNGAKVRNQEVPSTSVGSIDSSSTSRRVAANPMLNASNPAWKAAFDAALASGRNETMAKALANKAVSGSATGFPSSTAGAGQSTAEYAQNDPRRLDRSVDSETGETYSLYLPTLFTVNISLLVQYNLHKTVNEFTLEKFASGKLSSEGYI